MQAKSTLSREGRSVSPIRKRYVPTCCQSNCVDGFVIATSVEWDSTFDCARGTKFQITLIDAIGVAHTCEVTSCPVCGRDLPQIRCIEIDGWHSRQAEQTAVDEAVVKIREAQVALERAAKATQ